MSKDNPLKKKVDRRFTSSQKHEQAYKKRKNTSNNGLLTRLINWIKSILGGL